MLGKRYSQRLVALLVWACACLYLVTATRIGHSVEVLHQAWTEKPVAQQAIFACSIHKCQCQNALQCQTHCCCFPKGARDAHGHDGDFLTAVLKTCAGGVDEQGSLPNQAPHTLPAPGLAILLCDSESLPEPFPPTPLSPIADSPLKVPILLS